MTSLNWRKRACAVFLLCAGAVVPLSGQTFTTIYSFDDVNGADPYSMALVQGRDGSLYGTTLSGGNDQGTLFKITTAGTITRLHSFCSQSGCPDGSYPNAGLVLATDGNFYGTTWSGGVNNLGTVFKVTPKGTLTTLHSFTGSDGANPRSSLIQAIDGNFYGTTDVGGFLGPCGNPDGCGTVFRITSQGIVTTLYAFCSKTSRCADGAVPYAGLIQGTDGNFYGATAVGGNFGPCGNPTGCGTLFRVTRSGKLITLYTFCSQPDCTDGGGPFDKLVQAIDGTLFGATVEGGDLNCDPPFGCGTVFAINPSGVLTTLHVFEGSDGLLDESALVQGTDGNLYGTTVLGGDLRCGDNGCGTIYKITEDGTFTTLHTFEDSDGNWPHGTLMQATNGIFYGTTYLGGRFDSGTVFSLDLSLGPFVAFVRGTARVGQMGGILGQGFTGTTDVSINGIPAQFNVISDTFLKASVPDGATTGYVTVTTPSGTLTSNKPLIVLP